MPSIRDRDFILKLYRLCHRDVRDGVVGRHVEVHLFKADGLTVSLCDERGSLLDIVWQDGSAIVHRCHSFDAAVLKRPEALTKLVGAFLARHGFIDRLGRRRPGKPYNRRELALLLRNIAALRDAIRDEDWTDAVRLWGQLSPLLPHLLSNDPAMAGVATVLWQQERFAACDMTRTH